MVLNLIFLFRDKLHLLKYITLLVGASVILQTLSQLSTALQDFEGVTNALNNLRGNTGNVNIFAASLNVKIPFLVLGILHFDKWKKWFLALCLLSASFTVILISARAAYLGLFFQFVVFLIGYLKIHSFTKKTVVQTTYILIPIAVAIFLSSIVFKNSESVGRFESVSTRIEQIADTNEASASARLNYWSNAAHMISKDPITGIGLGNWRVESIPYERTTINDAFISSHTHNDFLEIAAETGIFNGLVYLTLFVIIFFINAKNIFTKNNTDKTISLLVLMLFTGYFIDAFFNFPLYRPTMQLAFALMIVFTVLNSTKQSIVAGNSQKIGLLLIMVSVFTTCISFMDWKAAQLEYRIKFDKPAVSANVILDKLPTITNVGIYGETFYQHAAIAFFNENNMAEAEKYFKLSNTINPFLGISNWYLHKIEKLKGNQNKAYEYVKSAFYARPRTLNFYLDGLRMAAVQKDTTEILKLHKVFSQYRSMPSNWKNTAVALSQAGYNPEKIEAFIVEGLKIFPKDSTLTKKIKQNTSTSTTQNNPTEAIENAPKTTNYMVEAKKMGEAKQFEKAIELYKKELTVNPEKKVIYQDIAICYFNLNKNETAINYLLKIVSDPTLNDGKTEYLLSGCYYKMQDKTNACKYLALAVDKKYPGTKDLFDKLCK
ncbi:MAG: O-antigen ligase family protein [Flavobacterium sp.]